MKKKNKKVLRTWVDCMLVIVNCIMFLIMGSEVADTKIFVVSHLLAGSVFVFNSYILIKYSRLIQE